MTKSKMTSVRRRRTNQRIQRQYDREKQARVRQYQERSFKARTTAGIAGLAWSGWFRKTIRRVTNFFNRMFSPGGALQRLDLRHSDAERFGPFNPASRRNAGAEYLRHMFGGNLKMVSTRDGRPV